MGLAATHYQAQGSDKVQKLEKSHVLRIVSNTNNGIKQEKKMRTGGSREYQETGLSNQLIKIHPFKTLTGPLNVTPYFASIKNWGKRRDEKHMRSYFKISA